MMIWGGEGESRCALGALLWEGSTQSPHRKLASVAQEPTYLSQHERPCPGQSNVSRADILPTSTHCLGTMHCPLSMGHGQQGGGEAWALLTFPCCSEWTLVGVGGPESSISCLASHRDHAKAWANAVICRHRRTGAS